MVWGGNIYTVAFNFLKQDCLFPGVSSAMQRMFFKAMSWGDRLEDGNLQLDANYINLNTFKVPLMRLIVSPAPLSFPQFLGRGQCLRRHATGSEAFQREFQQPTRRSLMEDVSWDWSMAMHFDNAVVVDLSFSVQDLTWLILNPHFSSWCCGLGVGLSVSIPVGVVEDQEIQYLSL